METLNRNHISFQEIDGLIGLAEKVSVNIEDLKRKVKSYKVERVFHLFLFVMALSVLLYSLLSGDINWLSNEINNNTFRGFIILIATLSSILLPFRRIIILFREINNKELTMQREEKVIKKLLNMIEGYKDLYIENEYGNESSVLSKALFEMRLSRIDFGA